MCVLAAGEECCGWQWQRVEFRIDLRGITYLEKRVCCWVADAEFPADSVVSTVFTS